MSRAAEIVILAEDQNLRKVIRRYLRKKANYSRHHIRVITASEASGLTLVQTQFPNQVQELRKTLKRRSAVLIIGADADEETVEARIQNLDRRLTNENIASRDSSEPIIFVIPKRNIETWMYYLAGNQVDEVTDYKPRCNKQVNDVWPANFVRFINNPLPADCPDSLRRACETELRRIPQA